MSWDVIVVGGGPGGALAAKRCAESGLRTLLLEKKKMPRDKCCSGMVMGPWGQQLVGHEFGAYPDDVLKETVLLDGYALHVAGAPARTLDIPTPATWRRALDSWMCRCAEDAGAEVWDTARVTDVQLRDDACLVGLRRAGQHIELTCQFVIGADGGNSAVRGALFPELEPVALHGYRECYRTELELPERRFNIFASPTGELTFFAHQKGPYLLVEGVAFGGTLKQTAARARQALVESSGLDPELEPLWRDGCLQPAIGPTRSGGGFRPARGNALLVGDAAGLHVPVTGEGLATSLKAGMEAADAVIEAKQRRQPAEGIYLAWVDELLARYQEIEQFSRQIGVAAAEADAVAYSEAMLASWDRALHLF